MSKKNTLVFIILKSLHPFYTIGWLFWLCHCSHTTPPSEHLLATEKSPVMTAPVLTPVHETILPPPLLEIPLESPADPSPQTSILRHIILVLPQEKAHAFASIGILKTLSQKNIPIRAILTTELSAIISILFLNSKTLNQFDWNIAQFNRHLPSQESFLQSLQNHSHLKNFLIEQCNASHFIRPITLYLQGKNDPIGPADRFLGDTLFDQFIHPTSFNNPFLALTEQAKMIHQKNPHDLMVYALPESVSHIADATIILPFVNILDNDYAKRTEIIYQGKKATLAIIPQLKTLLEGTPLVVQ